MYEPKTRPRRFLAVVAFIGSALLFLFWFLYWSETIHAGVEDSPIARFEAAFPAADALLALMLLGAGIGLLRGRAYGTFLLVGAAGMTLYLGILDCTFYFTQGMIDFSSADGRFQTAVIACCLVGGILGLWQSWRLWSTR